jgi:amino acid adenylation domain-containing protein
MSQTSAQTPELSPEEKRQLLAQLLQKKARQTKTLLPLSANQQALWFLYKLAPESWAYNVLFSARIRTELDLSAFKQSFQILSDRHASLRTIYRTEAGIPCQQVLEIQSVDFKASDASGWSQEQLHDEIVSEARRPFNLETGPVMRVRVLSQSVTDHILLITIHHIAIDLWSLMVLLEELRSIYSAQKAGTALDLPLIETEYTDYVTWQSQMLAGAEGERLRNYWQQKLAGELPVLNLPTDRPRSPFQSFAGASHIFQLSSELTVQLKNLARCEEATLYMVLLSAFQVLLHRYSHQEEICVGSPTAGRNRREFSNLVGDLVNSVVIRGNLSGNPSFRNFLGQMRNSVLEALKYQSYPFSHLVEHIHPIQGASHSPLFQALFNFQKLSRLAELSEFILPIPSDVKVEFGELILQPYPLPHQEGQFDVSLEMIEIGDMLQGIFKYNPELFEPSTIARMVGHFHTLLENIVKHPERSVSSLPLLTAAEHHQLLVEWNDTEREYPKDTCIHQLFEEQVAKTPDAVAVVFKDQQLTYRQLNQRANQLAHYLQTLGVGSEVLVGIYAERSLEMIVGLLGILKAGGAYVPLDPAYPTERLAFMLEDTQIPVLLTQQILVEKLFSSQAHVVCLDSDWEIIGIQSVENSSPEMTADNLAYVMYTSGSTGIPKGVCVIHRGVVRLVKETNYANFTSEDIFLQLASISFDASTFEIWGSLLNGAKLVLFPSDKPSLADLAQNIQQHQITILWLTAGLFHLMVDEELKALKSLRQMLAGGDVLSISHVQKFLQEQGDCQLINGYGPTENTTFTCYYRATEPSQLGNSIPIGRPICNTQVYILDSHLNPLPIGVPGELYIGGDGLARGYHNRPDLTMEKFIANPFSEEPTSHLYRTGDLVRYLLDGNIEFLGRLDNQVKIRGFRIELGEIEAIIAKYKGIRELIVIVREDLLGDKRLVAYIATMDNQIITSSELSKFLKTQLPEYMVPSTFVFLDNMPLTTNGKIDRRALLSSDISKCHQGKEFIAPRDKIEQQLADIWKKVLGHKSISIYDNFFDLGGHSLLSIHLVAEIVKTFGQNLPLSSFLKISTIAEIAQWIRENPSEIVSVDDLRLGLSVEEYTALLSHSAGKAGSRLGKRGLIINILPESKVLHQPFIWIGEVRTAKKLKLKQPVYVMPGASFSSSMSSQKDYISLISSVLVDELLSVQPSESYALGGWCYDGLVAMEVAHQLRKLGKKIDLVTLVEVSGGSRIYHWAYDLNSRLGSIRFHLLNLLNLSFKEKWRYIKERVRRKIYFKKGKEAVSESDSIQEILSIQFQATKEYNRKVYTGRVLLVLGKRHIVHGRRDVVHFDLSWLFPHCGWGNLLQGNVTVSKLPCDHGDLVEHPYIEEIGEMCSLIQRE